MNYHLPSDIFESVDNLKIYTPDQIQQDISHNSDLLCIDVVSKDTTMEDIDQFLTRRGIWIPNQYAELFLE